MASAPRTSDLCASSGLRPCAARALRIFPRFSANRWRAVVFVSWIRSRFSRSSSRSRPRLSAVCTGSSSGSAAAGGLPSSPPVPGDAPAAAASETASARTIRLGRLPLARNRHRSRSRTSWAVSSRPPRTAKIPSPSTARVAPTSGVFWFHDHPIMRSALARSSSTSKPWLISDLQASTAASAFFSDFSCKDSSDVRNPSGNFPSCIPLSVASSHSAESADKNRTSASPPGWSAGVSNRSSSSSSAASASALKSSNFRSRTSLRTAASEPAGGAAGAWARAELIAAEHASNTPAASPIPSYRLMTGPSTLQQENPAPSFACRSS